MTFFELDEDDLHKIIRAHADSTAIKNEEPAQISDPSVHLENLPTSHIVTAQNRYHNTQFDAFLALLTHRDRLDRAKAKKTHRKENSTRTLFHKNSEFASHYFFHFYRSRFLSRVLYYALMVLMLSSVFFYSSFNEGNEPWAYPMLFVAFISHIFYLRASFILPGFVDFEPVAKFPPNLNQKQKSNNHNQSRIFTFPRNAYVEDNIIDKNLVDILSKNPFFLSQYHQYCNKFRESPVKEGILQDAQQTSQQFDPHTNIEEEMKQQEPIELTTSFNPIDQDEQKKELINSKEQEEDIGDIDQIGKSELTNSHNFISTLHFVPSSTSSVPKPSFHLTALVQDHPPLLLLLFALSIENHSYDEKLKELGIYMMNVSTENQLEVKKTESLLLERIRLHFTQNLEKNANLKESCTHSIKAKQLLPHTEIMEGISKKHDDVQISLKRRVHQNAQKNSVKKSESFFNLDSDDDGIDDSNNNNHNDSNDEELHLDHDCSSAISPHLSVPPKSIDMTIAPPITNFHFSILQNIINHPSFCVHCRIVKPHRTKHCYTCGHCIARHDHHCPFVGNCVGAQNHFRFIIFMLTHLLPLIYGLKVNIVSFPEFQLDSPLLYVYDEYFSALSYVSF